MNLQKIGHLVLTVADVERSCRFYCDVMGMRRIMFGENRTALDFGEKKLICTPSIEIITLKPIIRAQDQRICVLSLARTCPLKKYLCRV